MEEQEFGQRWSVGHPRLCSTVLKVKMVLVASVLGGRELSRRPVALREK